jgi:hypothetical protein
VLRKISPFLNTFFGGGEYGGVLVLRKISPFLNTFFGGGEYGGGR